MVDWINVFTDFKIKNWFMIVKGAFTEGLCTPKLKLRPFWPILIEVLRSKTDSHSERSFSALGSFRIFQFFFRFNETAFFHCLTWSRFLRGKRSRAITEISVAARQLLYGSVYSQIFRANLDWPNPKRSNLVPGVLSQGDRTWERGWKRSWREGLQPKTA